MTDDAAEAGRVALQHLDAYIEQVHRHDAMMDRVRVGGMVLLAIVMALLVRSWIRG